MAEEQLPGQYPTPAGVPLANRCTIARNPSPGVRPRVPFPGRLRTTPSREGLRDVYFSDRYRGAAAVAAGVLVTLPSIGIVQKPCRTGRLIALVYDIDVGAWLSDAASFLLLAGVDFMVTLSGVPIFQCQGYPGHSFGVPFAFDARGGEVVGVVVDNTDATSTLDGERVVLQVFFDYEPEYQIEDNRKGNPYPS